MACTLCKRGDGDLVGLHDNEARPLSILLCYLLRLHSLRELQHRHNPTLSAPSIEPTAQLRS